MKKIKEWQTVVIFKQSISLTNILGDSQSYILGMLWFLLSIFMFGGVDGDYSLMLWLISLYSIYLLFKNALDAAEVGL